MTAAIGIICKTPIPGQSKTRLIPLVGAEGAAELAGCFLRDIAATISDLPATLACRGYAIFAPEGSEARLRVHLPDEFALICRRDATLGSVLLGAVRDARARGHDCAVLVNADSPTLSHELLAEAVAAIRAPGPRVVLGPAIDGGYYLIALKHDYPELFDDIPWSTSGVYAATVRRAGAIGLPVVTLPPWYDVDDAETLQMLVDELCDGRLPFDAQGRRGGRAAATRAFLDRHPELTRKTVRSAAPAGAGGA